MIPFDVEYWIGKREAGKKPLTVRIKSDLLYQMDTTARTTLEEVEIVTRRIERAMMDISPTYQEWLQLGFALANGLGEAGRNYYHRLSSFHHKYTYTETEKQYNHCLKSHGHGVTIRSFFQLAKDAGININTRTKE